MKVIVYPGSFDPITNGHLQIAKEALKSFDKVILLVANNNNKKERFTNLERYEMVKGAVEGIKGLEAARTDGMTVDFLKKEGTCYLLRGIRNNLDMKYEEDYAKQIHAMDKSVEFVYIASSEEYSSISSTSIHEMALAKKDIDKYVPKSVVERYKKAVRS